MGWGQESKPTYVLQSYIDKESNKNCMDLINDAEVVIWGSCPFEMIKPRLKAGKLTFAYSERIFKKGNKGLAFWGRALKYFLKLHNFQHNHYLLCASAYAAHDYQKIGLFKIGAYKWGYFPEVKDYNIDYLFDLKRTNGEVSILWTGRLIKLKQPDASIRLAMRLRSAGYNFQLNIIGNGVLEKQLQKMILENNLEAHVHLLGSMKPNEVRKYMERAKIFLFTSDQNEGWGAVLNESMNSGCAVVANRVIGSVPFMIENKKNGLIYDSEDEMYQHVTNLLNDDNLCVNLGSNAYKTMAQLWNAHTAVERVLTLSRLLQKKNTIVPWCEGPCSVANILGG